MKFVLVNRIMLSTMIIGSCGLIVNGGHGDGIGIFVSAITIIGSCFFAFCKEDK